MLGPAYSLLAGSLLSLSSIFLRMGVYRSGESFTSVPISTAIGILFLGVPFFIATRSKLFTSLSWSGVASLGAAGILHFLIGRFLAFTSFRLIGANRAIPILACNIVLAAVIGIIFLGEPLTISLVPALCLIVGGISLIGIAGNAEPDKQGISRGSSAKGIAAALGGVLCWGTSPTLIKMGLQEVNSPLLASFVSYAAAFLVISILSVHPWYYEKFRRLDRLSLIPLLIGGATASLAQIARYTALQYSSVTIVTSLINTTTTLFVFPFSFLIIRHIEAFDFRIISGAIIIVVGIFLLLFVV